MYHEKSIFLFLFTPSVIQEEKKKTTEKGYHIPLLRSELTEWEFDESKSPAKDTQNLPH